MWTYNYSNELYHYGVLGMKWGIRRAKYYKSRAGKIAAKSFKYDIKSERLAKKAEKIHSQEDLGSANRAANKSAKYAIKADKLRKKALKTDNDFEKNLLNSKAARLDYKSAKANIKANRISKTTGYSAKAMSYSIKSDVFKAKAEKMRMKLAKNETFLASMKAKVSSLSVDDVKRKEFERELRELDELERIDADED